MIQVPPIGPLDGAASEESIEAEDLDRIPQQTTLQRAFVAHLRSGRHWAIRAEIRLAG